MTWCQSVVENLVMLKRAGYQFEESWQVTLETFPYGSRHGRPDGRLFDDDGGLPDEDVVNYCRARCYEAWHGERPHLVAVADAIRDELLVDRGGVARGRNVPAPLAA